MGKISTAYVILHKDIISDLLLILLSIQKMAAKGTKRAIKNRLHIKNINKISRLIRDPQSK